MRYALPLLLLPLLLQTCAVIPKGSYDSLPVPAAPDYAELDYWAAHPGKEDLADLTPGTLEDRQHEAEVDVFWLHPTRYMGKKGENLWNGPVDDPELNEKVDGSSIKYQASLFNGVGKVYAPRYRQAHIHAYYTDNEVAAEQAFDLAYQDVKAAFEYYLEHYNQGRPIIIASHSQGTTHALQLLKEYFDGKPLQNRLVVAYLAGVAVLKDEFEQIPVCQSAVQTGCFCSWRTWRNGKRPKKYVSPKVAVTNPLNWTTTDTLVNRAKNEGAVLRDFKKIRPETVDARIEPELGILWVRPRFFGQFLFGGNFHIADINFFYLDIRANAQKRINAFWK